MSGSVSLPGLFTDRKRVPLFLSIQNSSTHRRTGMQTPVTHKHMGKLIYKHDVFIIHNDLKIEISVICFDRFLEKAVSKMFCSRLCFFTRLYKELLSD